MTISLFYGVDFSAAKDAGRKIWVTKANLEDGKLVVESCTRGDDLPGGAVSRDTALWALRDFIAAQGACAFGMDFPFSVPKQVMQRDSWRDYVLNLRDDTPKPEVFREACRSRSDGRDLKRRTDTETKTPLGAYNLRLYKQTFYGIADVLAPLVRDDAARVLPMQPITDEKPLLLEICPASTLKVERLYQPYKGRGDAERAQRAHILDALGGMGVHVPLALHTTLIEDSGADALDSVIAAFATWRTFTDTQPDFSADANDDVYALEGRVYV